MIYIAPAWDAYAWAKEKQSSKWPYNIWKLLQTREILATKTSSILWSQHEVHVLISKQSFISINTTIICWYFHLLSLTEVINKVKCPLKSALNTDAHRCGNKCVFMLICSVIKCAVLKLPKEKRRGKKNPFVLLSHNKKVFSIKNIYKHLWTLSVSMICRNAEEHEWAMSNYVPFCCSDFVLDTVVCCKSQSQRPACIPDTQLKLCRFVFKQKLKRHQFPAPTSIHHCAPQQ